jgi:tetratricopeptide (TPR) repeat protein
MGDHQHVLAEIGMLRETMGELPHRRGSNETVNPWNVREAILDIGRSSASALGRWQQSLELSGEILASKRQRGASQHEIARTRFNDSGTLIRLGRLAEAERLLRSCQQVFEDHRDAAGLAMVLSTRAYLESELGHWETAVDFARTALRLGYTHPDPRDIAASHHNLASHLARVTNDPASQRAHRLAAALIYQLTGMSRSLTATIQVLARELGDADDQELPARFNDITALAEQTDGVRLRELIEALEPDGRTVETALVQILRTADETELESDLDAASYLRQWQPVIAMTIAAARGDHQAAAELAPALEPLASSDWAALIAVLRRIVDGERGDSLLEGLDPIDTAIATEVLAGIGT